MEPAVAKQNKLEANRAEFARLMSDPTIPSATEAWIQSGHTSNRKSASVQASRALADPRVAAAVSKLTHKRQDKTRGTLEKLESAANRAIRKLSSVFESEDLTFQEALAGAKVLSDIREQEHKIREKYPDADQDEAGRRHYARAIKRIVYHSLGCGMDRPAVAARAMERLAVELGYASEDSEE
jgi:tRNA U54 and U55 pseudouridine synthase Pus10